MSAASEDDVVLEPRFASERFVCVHSSCRALAEHAWSLVGTQFPGRPLVVEGMKMARCGACGQLSLWVDQRLAWPMELVGDDPHPDMPEDARTLYVEAQSVAALSPSSAAALQRRALQTLVDALVPEKGDLHHKIGRLVEKGISSQTQKAMDIVRVFGNNGVHPGEINLDEAKSLIPGLFKLMNLVVEEVIANPRRVSDLYIALPRGALAAIEGRDGANQRAARAPS